jgi:muramoyltetrapeptide carboxypeptidase
MIIPPYLKQGDKVAIVSPAKVIRPHEIEFAVKELTNWGLMVELGSNTHTQWNRFAGTDSERLYDTQWALNNPEIRAVFFARGGYGSVRIIDQLDFTHFKNSPKWLIGFSDITVFHQHVFANFQTATCHGPMPLNFNNNDNNLIASNSLKSLLFGENICYQSPCHELNQLGEVEGILVGGNLSVLASLIGTNSQVNYHNKILFIEDLCEELYHLDRMLFQLKKANVFEQISGLIIGGFTEMTDVSGWFDTKHAYNIIKDHISNCDIPVAFGFSVGHIARNLALGSGLETRLKVAQSLTVVKQKSHSE